MRQNVPFEHVLWKIGLELIWVHAANCGRGVSKFLAGGSDVRCRERVEQAKLVVFVSGFVGGMGRSTRQLLC